MGITRAAVKTSVAVFCFWSSVFAYSVGEQRGAVERKEMASGTLLEPLKSFNLRGELFEAAQRSDSVAISNATEALLKRAPLDAFVFEIALGAATSDANMDAAENFANRAIQRKPRSLAARLFQFSIASINEDAEAILEAYSRISHMGTFDPRRLDRALIGIFREREEWSELLLYVTQRPPSGDNLAELLLEEQIDSIKLRNVISKYPSLQGKFLLSLVENRDFDLARSSWFYFTMPNQIDQKSAIFNTKFLSRSEPIPFNWQLFGNRVEYMSSGGLYVSYLGIERSLIARQIVSSNPGTYLLSTTVKGDKHDDGGSLHWIVRCLENDERIHSSEIKPLSIVEARTISASVVVPNVNCSHQSLELWGQPGEFPKRSVSQLLLVDMNRVGG